MKAFRAVLSATALLGLATSVARAQIVVEPMIGGYVPGSNMNAVPAATDLAKSRDGTLSFGANVSMSFLRVSAAYASGTTIKNAAKADIGKGNVFALSGDVVIRPLPRILVQPYIVAGAGEKFYKYDQGAAFTTSNSDKRFALHGGVGADVALGPLGVVAELTDFISKNDEKKWNVHDTFLMVGLRIPLGL